MPYKFFNTKQYFDFQKVMWMHNCKLRAEINLICMIIFYLSFNIIVFNYAISYSNMKKEKENYEKNFEDYI